MKTARWLEASDLHVPHHDPVAVDWVEAQIREYKPQYLILNGDTWDANAASRWPNEYKHHLEDEYEQSAEVLRRFRAAAGRNATLVLIWGNHCDNIVAPNRVNEAVRSLVRPGRVEPLKSELAHWVCRRSYRNHPSCVYRLGSVFFVHGFSCAKNSDRDEAMRFGWDYGLVVRGHTHRPHQVERCRFNSVLCNRWFANSGCLVRLDPPPDYVWRRNTQEWGQAVVVGETALINSPRVGRYWDAELKIHKMAWDADVKDWKTAL